MYKALGIEQPFQKKNDFPDSLSVKLMQNESALKEL